MTRLPQHGPPTHPGEMLLEEFLKPHGMSQINLAERIQVPCNRINQLVRGRRGITTEISLRLAALFETTPEFWLNGQLNWDLWHAMRGPTAKVLKSIKPVIGGPPA